MTAVAAFDDVMAPGRLLRQDFRGAATTRFHQPNVNSWLTWSIESWLIKRS
jgi:hypothetical protein